MTGEEFDRELSRLRERIEYERDCGGDYHVAMFMLIGCVTAHDDDWNRTWTSEQLEKVFNIIWEVYGR